jgi:hypothetical protein
MRKCVAKFLNEQVFQLHSFTPVIAGPSAWCESSSMHASELRDIIGDEFHLQRLAVDVSTEAESQISAR